MGLSKQEFIDVRVDGEYFYFISASPEVFAAYRARYKGESPVGGLSFRVSRFLLSKVYADGIIAFKIGEKVTVALYGSDGKLKYSFSAQLQDAYGVEYEERFSLMNTLDEQSSLVYLDDLHAINSVTRFLPSVVCVSDGVAGAVLKDNTRIYMKLNCNGRFALSSYALSLLLRFAVSAFNVRNYLCVKLNDLWLCVTKSNVLSQDEFSFAEEQKSALICDIDFENLCDLYRQIDLKLPYVDVDLNANEIKLEYHNSVFSVPLSVTNLRCAPGLVLKPVRLPTSIIVEIFQKTRLSTFRFYKKKNFNELEAKGIYVIFR